MSDQGRDDTVPEWVESAAAREGSIEAILAALDESGPRKHVSDRTADDILAEVPGQSDDPDGRTTTGSGIDDVLADLDATPDGDAGPSKVVSDRPVTDVWNDAPADADDDTGEQAAPGSKSASPESSDSPEFEASSGNGSDGPVGRESAVESGGETSTVDSEGEPSPNDRGNETSTVDRGDEDTSLDEPEGERPGDEDESFDSLVGSGPERVVREGSVDDVLRSGDSGDGDSGDGSDHRGESSHPGDEEGQPDAGQSSGEDRQSSDEGGHFGGDHGDVSLPSVEPSDRATAETAETAEAVETVDAGDRGPADDEAVVGGTDTTRDGVDDLIETVDAGSSERADAVEAKESSGVGPLIRDAEGDATAAGETRTDDAPGGRHCDGASPDRSREGSPDDAVPQDGSRDDSLDDGDDGESGTGDPDDGDADDDGIGGIIGRVRSLFDRD